MPVAKVIQIIGHSPESFAKAADEAVQEATKTVRGITGADVIWMSADVEHGRIWNSKTTVNVAFAVEATEYARPRPIDEVSFCRHSSSGTRRVGNVEPASRNRVACPGEKTSSAAALSVSRRKRARSSYKVRQQLQELITNSTLMRLQIGQNVDEESRRFTLLGNIMKTKHDSAKNSIRNIR